MVVVVPLFIAASLCPDAAAQTAPVIVPVIGRAATPNAFQPALPCTLMLIAPGNKLLARGLTMFADPPAVPTANGDFDYAPFGADDYSFDQVNVFHHAQRYLERLQRYGLDLDEYPIYLRVQRGIGSATNQTEPNTAIGTGLDGRNADAKDSDIIVHELTHAVFNPRMPTDQYPGDKGEALPVAEGLADYFAVAVNGDTHLGEYSSPPNGYYDIATDSSVYNYGRWNDVPGDPYSRGKVLNGALLSLRRRIGETADELVFAALKYRPLRCMPCFADAVRWADAERFGGANRDAIDAAFASRGIGGGPPSHLSISGPQFLWTGDSGVIRVKHHCGLGPYSTDWSTSADGGRTWLPLAGHLDSIAVTPSAPFVIRATLHDQRGGEFFPPQQSFAVYASDDPQLRFHGVHIRGLAAVPPNAPATFTAALDGGIGVAPVRFAWTVEGATVIGPRDQASISVTPALGALRLTVLHSDAAGQSERDSVQVPVDLGSRVVRAIHIQGPAALDPLRALQYSYVTDGGPGFDPLTTHWKITGGRFVTPSDNVTSVFVLPTSLHPGVSLTYVDAAGQAARDSLALAVDLGTRVVRGIHVHGPLALEANQVGVYTYALDGGPGFDPPRILWANVGGRFTGASDNVPSVSITSRGGPQQLSVLYIDAVGQSVADTLTIPLVDRLAAAIAGPDVVSPGHAARFTAQVAGGLPPYVMEWSQSVAGALRQLPAGPEALLATCLRPFTLVLTTSDRRGVTLRDTSEVAVAPTVDAGDAATSAPRVFRVLGSVAGRGEALTFELPGAAAGGWLDVLDLAGRVLFRQPLAADGAATVTLASPRPLEAGMYFARLVRPGDTRVARFVVVPR